jgi:hypothetical protein
MEEAEKDCAGKEGSADGMAASDRTAIAQGCRKVPAIDRIAAALQNLQDPLRSSVAPGDRVEGLAPEIVNPKIRHCLLSSYAIG